LFGLAAMHTIGHGGVDHAGHHAESQEPAAGVTLAMGGAAPDGCCSHAAELPIRGGGMGSWDLCVAVLSAFAVAVLLAALLLITATGRHPPRSARDPSRWGSRAPPILPFGLTLATVSVLRT
jgi:hypothetical protein